MCPPGLTPFDSLVLSLSKDELAQDRRGSAPTGNVAGQQASFRDLRQLPQRPPDARHRRGDAAERAGGEREGRDVQGERGCADGVGAFAGGCVGCAAPSAG